MPNLSNNWQLLQSPREIMLQILETEETSGCVGLPFRLLQLAGG